MARSIRPQAVLLRAVLVAGFVVAGSTPSRAASFTPLGFLSAQRPESEPTDLSADGRVVVGISGGEAFVWDSASGMQLLPVLPGATESRAFGVSGDGTVVVGNSGCCEAVVWPSRQSVTALAGLEGFDVRRDAVAVSADGSVIAGWSERLDPMDGGGANEAVFWLGIGDPQGIGDLAGGRFNSYAGDISADGSTVVGNGQANLGREAFIWDATNGLRGLGVLPGGDFKSTATAVSADGSVVVGSSARKNRSEAFIWDESGGMRGIGDLPGQPFWSVALGVSGDGSTVVGLANANYLYDSEAFVWDEQSGMRSLQDVLQAEGVDLTGWTLFEATGISNDGSTVIGRAINPDGHPEAFVATLGAPSPPAASPIPVPAAHEATRRLLLAAILSIGVALAVRSARVRGSTRALRAAGARVGTDADGG